MQYSSNTDHYASSYRDSSPTKWSSSKDHKDDKGGYMYKKSSYQYASNSNNNNSLNTSSNSYSYNSSNKTKDQNIDQLDALLEDLKNERQFTRDNSYRTIERERGDFGGGGGGGGTVTRTTRIVKTSKHGGGANAMLDDVENFSTSDYSTLRSNGYPDTQLPLGNSSTLKRNEYQTKEITYGTTARNLPSNNVSNISNISNIYESKNKMYESNRTLDSTATELVPTSPGVTTVDLETDLQNIALSENILPMPGTKVTTTVRTYTYEVPAGGLPSPNAKQLVGSNYSTLQRNEYSSNTNNITSTTTSGSPSALQPGSRPHVPQTVVYNTESYSTINRNNDRPVVSNQSYEVREHRETTNTLRNNSRMSSPSPLPHQQPRSPGYYGPPGGSNTTKTVVYNVNTTENVHTSGPPDTIHLHPQPAPLLQPSQHYPRSPPQSPQSAPQSPQPLGGQGPPHTTNRYYYKESSNVVNTIHGPPPPRVEPPTHTTINTTTTTILPSHNTPQRPTGGYPPNGGSGYPPNGVGPYPNGGPPPGNSTITYKYTTSTTSNTHRGPDYGGPSPSSMPPAPFPVDGVGDGNPPQRVDDLMQSFGNADAVDRSHELPHRKREIETAVASPNQPIIPSVNRAGKEIYYPPGHESMMMKREEMAAGSAAGGRWAKGSGMYEYESGYKSKTKTKSGGAMVPVCLPLCCAMPCTIM